MICKVILRCYMNIAIVEDEIQYARQLEKQIEKYSKEKI